MDPLSVEARRKARKIAEIDPAALAALERGELETTNLVEWLAIDLRVLLANVLPAIDLDRDASARILSRAEELADEGIMDRLRGIGTATFAEAGGDPAASVPLEQMATHPSDMVRVFAAYAVAEDPEPSFRERLARMKRFAADSSMATRECAWEAYRRWFRNDVEGGIRELLPWVGDADENVRRCAVEGTRPRGVWTAHVPELKERPELASDLLEPVRSDPSRYVQNAVANWLNDASRTQPDWVIAITDRWRAESETRETAYIVRRGLRTLRKDGRVS